MTNKRYNEILKAARRREKFQRQTIKSLIIISVVLAAGLVYTLTV